MITGEIRSKVDALWNAFWTGGISNPLEVIEQITYLLFLKRLDDLHTLEENKSARLKRPMERRIFPEGADPKKRSYDDLRWNRFKHFEAKEMFEVVNDHVFPFLRTLGGDSSTYAHHMKDARFTIPTPALLAKVVDHDRRRAHGGPRYQGRPLRIHARQDRPAPGRTASSAPRATSSSSWWK
jgi:type I restriction enzyme M protein